MNPGESSPVRVGLYRAILATCAIALLAGVLELATHRYLAGIATMVVAGLVSAVAFGRRELFSSKPQSLDEMKATTRSIPTNLRLQLTAFCAALVIGGVLGILFAIAEIAHGALGFGLLIGLPSLFFAIAGGSGAVAFWLPRNRGPA